MPLQNGSLHAQMLVITSSGIFVVCSNVQLQPSLDRNVVVTRRVTSSYLWSFLCSMLALYWVEAVERVGRWQELTVSSAMASGRPGMSLADWRALSMTDWWYCEELVSLAFAAIA